VCIAHTLPKKQIALHRIGYNAGILSRFSYRLLLVGWACSSQHLVCADTPAKEAPAHVSTIEVRLPKQSEPNHLQDAAAIIQAVAALLWPLVVLAALMLFKREIKQLLARIRKGKLFGQELELEASVKELEAKAVVAEKDVAAVSLPTEHDDSLPRSSASDWEREVLVAASNSPRAAILLLASHIEKQVLDLLAMIGHSKNRPRRALPQLFKEHPLSSMFPSSVAESVALLWRIRNAVAHGGGSGGVSDEEVLSAVDSGITIGRAIQSFPREVNIVAHAAVVVFTDASGTQIRQDVTAVILDTRSAGGVLHRKRVYPTTRTDYKPGDVVTWEWALDRIVEESWYRDPEDGAVKYAWTSSGLFVGRPIINPPV
jgi:hypothetical protein